ncbi:hypothetical protein KSE_40290 [Kitasatospora setae KM-6054]|uniref:Uncharacterized protein n=1 Tax=Kitasatospora setae (strain ATCC 33774 / DSM 43861 / JCM 3304 / KCC A-0304 / NBRC 14216 / KM-6054) TaxID=452652 RepID=E4NEN5_KITSK|nr:hypothetical protein KSE_40290 [Kitasatospora setae KM-6054]
MLCALLLGLFLMHGSPASATGCHPAAPVPAPHHAPAADPTMAAAPAPHHAPAVGSARPGADPASATVPVRHGSSASGCVSTQARDRAPVPAPGAALPPHPPLPPLAAPGGAGAERGGRAPPDDGRDVLLRVCVARR